MNNFILSFCNCKVNKFSGIILIVGYSFLLFTCIFALCANIYKVYMGRFDKWKWQKCASSPVAARCGGACSVDFDNGFGMTEVTVLLL